MLLTKRICSVRNKLLTVWDHLSLTLCKSYHCISGSSSAQWTSFTTVFTWCFTGVAQWWSCLKTLFCSVFIVESIFLEYVQRSTTKTFGNIMRPRDRFYTYYFEHFNLVLNNLLLLLRIYKTPLDLLITVAYSWHFKPHFYLDCGGGAFLYFYETELSRSTYFKIFM